MALSSKCNSKFNLPNYQAIIDKHTFRLIRSCCMINDLFIFGRSLLFETKKTQDQIGERERELLDDANATARRTYNRGFLFSASYIYIYMRFLYIFVGSWSGIKYLQKHVNCPVNSVLDIKVAMAPSTFIGNYSCLWHTVQRITCTYYGTIYVCRRLIMPVVLS